MKTIGYNYSEIILNRVYTALCGGNATEDVNYVKDNTLKHLSEKEAIIFYNKRGDSERVFDMQNNDFNWDSMPHSFLEENTVYLIIMAVFDSCN